FPWGAGADWHRVARTSSGPVPRAPGDDAGGRAWSPVVVFALVFVLLRLPELVKPLAVDQANFEVAARELSRGKVLYRDVFDVKPPLVFRVYQAVQLVGGSGASAVAVADALAVLVTFALLGLALHPLMGRRALVHGLSIGLAVASHHQLGSG